MNKSPEASLDIMKVLIVDDDLTILSLLKEIVGMVPGVEVFTAARPDEAMKVIVSGSVDIVFTDIHMPGVTGLEMIQDIISLQQCPEVIVMTALPSGEIAQQAMELGASSLLAKPFEDIKLVELELDKAIKKVIRKRATADEVAKKKAELAKIQPVEVDDDPVMQVSLDSFMENSPIGSELSNETDEPATSPAPGTTSEPIAAPTPMPVLNSPTSKVEAQQAAPSNSVKASAQPASDSKLSLADMIASDLKEGLQKVDSEKEVTSLSEPEAEPEEKPKPVYDDNPANVKIYPAELLEPFIEVEIPRCKRHHRKFTIGLIDLPENVQLKTMKERMDDRNQQIESLKTCVRTSDVLLDAGKDGFVMLAYECNTPGSNVLEHKLAHRGFDFCGFAVYPTDAEDLEGLKTIAQKRLIEKRRHHLVLYEPEEFFGRIVTNMLTDPKYQVSYFQDINKLGDFVRDKYSKIKLLMVSLSTDQQQWAFLDRCQKEGLAQWPVLLFTEVALNPQVKKQLFQLGVRAVVKKGCSQEELQYVVQSFIMQASANLLRKNARALITLPAVYKFDGKEVSSNTFTLSRDGVFIRDLAPPPTGSLIDLKVFIPGRSAALATRGEVIYSVPYFVGVNRIHVSGMAVKFLDLTETDQKEIDQFVSRALTGYLMEEESET